MIVSLVFEGEHIRRGIEVVITGLTRNQFARKRTRVRIPSSPPYSEAKKDIMASNPRNLTISGVFLAFPRFFAAMRFADTECRKKDIISKKRLRTGC